MKISLYAGDICDAPADVICTSTNRHIELIAGTGASVRERGGWELQEDCRLIVREHFRQTGESGMPVGAVVVTPGGKLPYSEIYHCVVFDIETGPTAQGIEACVRQALQLANGEKKRTLAIPILGAGKAHFGFAESLDVILGVLKEDAWPEVDRVWVTVHDPARGRAAYEIMEEKLGRRVEVRSVSGRESADAIPMRRQL